MNYRFTEQAGSNSGVLHRVKWKKPVSKGCIPWVTDPTVHQRQNLYGDEELLPGCQGWGVGWGCDYSGRAWGIGGEVTQLLCILILVVVVVVQVSTCVKIHKAVYQKQPTYCMFVKKCKMRTLRSSTVESSLVSRHPSWPGPNCGLDGSCVQSEDVRPGFVRSWASITHWLFSSLC